MSPEQARHLFRRQVAHLRRAWIHRIFSLRTRGQKVYCEVEGLKSLDEREQIVSHLRHLGFSKAYLLCVTYKHVIRLNP